MFRYHYLPSLYQNQICIAVTEQQFIDTGVFKNYKTGIQQRKDITTFQKSFMEEGKFSHCPRILVLQSLIRE